MKFVAEVGIGVMQVFADAHQRLVEGEAGLDANDGKVECVGQSDADAPLAVFDHALENKTWDEETQCGHAHQQGHAIYPGEDDDTGEAKNGQHDTRSEIIADMAGLAKSGLNEPRAGAGYVGGRKRDGFAEGIEGLLDALPYFQRRLLRGHRRLTAESAQAGSEHGSGRHGGRAEGEHHQGDGNKHDDGQDQRHAYT